MRALIVEGHQYVCDGGREPHFLTVTADDHALVLQPHARPSRRCLARRSWFSDWPWPFAFSGSTGWGYQQGGISATGSADGSYHLQNVYTFSDDLFYTRGRNGFKFGALINRFNQALTAAKSDGNLNFATASDFLSGLARFYQGTTGGLTGDDAFNTFGLYVQDDFRATKRLTLNMGLRYEFRTTINELSGYPYALPKPLTDTTATRGPINRNPSLYNFSPRLGFAWDIFGDGKTALRGAAGIYYDLANYGQAIEQLCRSFSILVAKIVSQDGLG